MSSLLRRDEEEDGGFFFRALETLSGDGDDRFRTRLSSTRRRVARKRGIYAGTHIRDTFAELTHSGIVVCIFFCTRVFFSLWCTIIIIIIIIIANSVHVCDAFVRFCVSSRRKKEGRKNTPPRVERSSLVFGPQKKRGVKWCV